MKFITNVVKDWVILAVTSFGLWAILFQLSGLWVDDSSLVGYHSYSGDTSYLSLRTLVLVVIAAKLVQALILTKVSARQRTASFVSIGIVENLLWLSILLNNYGIKSQGSFDVAIGYGYLLAFALLSNVTLVICLLVQSKVRPIK